MRAADIQAVLTNGARRRSSKLEIIWCSNDQGHPRVGIITPRFGRSAVARNRLRRRLREHARRQMLPTLPPLDLLIRTRPPAYAVPFHDLASDLDRWRQLLAS